MDEAFVFIGGSVAEAAGKIEQWWGAIALSQAQPTARVLVLQVRCGELNPRLAHEGVALGVVLTLVSCLPSGSVIVQTAQRRVGLGAEIARHIDVQVVLNE